MEENGLMRREKDGMIPAEQMQELLFQMGDAMRNMNLMLQSMGEMIRVSNERMGELEREVRMLTKVTPAQATAINTAIRARAVKLCQQYRTTGAEKTVCNAIRKEVKLTCGVNNVRELPRCEYSLAMQQIGIWDDYARMKELKAKHVGR